MNNRALKIYLFYCSNSLNAKELSLCRDELKDHQLKIIEGNMRAEKRAEAVDSLLDEIGAGTGRITAIHIREGRIEETIGEIKKFCARISQVKPAPAAQER